MGSSTKLTLMAFGNRVRAKYKKKMLGVQSIEHITHSSQFQGLCSTKSSSETIQNLPYFWNAKTHVGFFFFDFMLLCLFH